MSFRMTDLGPLAEQFSRGDLYHAWLTGQSVLGSCGAGEELAAALTAPDPARLAPLWQADEFAACLPAEFRNLPQGPAVVVTGQQPGFLGGPLLTLYKIATAVSLAAQRTAAGRPTVPVFWSGDDDDDLAEALATVGWDRDTGALVRSDLRHRLTAAETQRFIVADLAAADWAASGREYLQKATTPDGLQNDLAGIMAAAVAHEQTMGPGQAAVLARLFAGTGLVIIRGHDRRLHRIATPFYERLAGQLDALAAVGRERGAELVNAGYHAQISERSLSRPLFLTEQGRRRPVREFTPDDIPGLRPGVMLRSPLQDWLLQPAAVVVGPGELAYLRQLDPLYAALAVPRSPLVPRMSGWVLPKGAVTGELATLIRPGQNEQMTAPDRTAEAWADAVIAPAQREMARLLVDNLGLPPERAAAMADSRARRFRKGVLAMFRAETARQDHERVAEAPPWILPDGRRQERALGLLSAVGLWGQDLLTAILAAAETHLTNGRRDNWRELAIMVPAETVSR